jgi:putative toxin-antitoxin system antitoxin component (TIGR02293 family)
MTDLRERDAPQYQAEELELTRITNLLGGRQVLRHLPRNPLEAHELLVQGLPIAALTHLIDNLLILRTNISLVKAVGMSIRTYQRHKDMPKVPLSQEQSGRTWKFAEILSRATAVLGSQEEAEQWLERPAIGLDQRRPIDLLTTPAGVELVDQFLKRLEYGVYV